MPLLVLSPSQQEGNQYAGGGTGYTDSEEYWMRRLASRVKEIWDWQQSGIQCAVVNQGSYSANCTESNRLKATEHVGLHTNAGGGQGTEIFCYKSPTTGAVSAKGKALADALYAFIAPASNAPDRGVKTSSTFGELRQTAAPAVIIEYAFHDSVHEAQEIRTSIEEFAIATVQGLCRYYGKAFKPLVAPAPPAPPVVTPDPTLPMRVWAVEEQNADRIVLVRRYQ